MRTSKVITCHLVLRISLLPGKQYEGIFPVWNWNKIPGTTAVQHPDSARLEGYLFGRNRFGGGVSNGRNGVIAYEHCYRGVKAKRLTFLWMMYFCV